MDISHKLKSLINDLTRLQRFAILVAFINNIFIFKVIDNFSSIGAQLSCILGVLFLNNLLSIIVVLKDINMHN